MKLRDYQGIAAARDPHALQEALVRVAHRLDFGLISSALVVEAGVTAPTVLRFGNIPDAYRARSESKVIGQRDPVLRRMKRLSVPFSYDQSMYVSEQATDLWEAQAEFGYKTGIATALHLPHSRHFIIGVNRERPLPLDEGELARLHAEVQLLAVYATEASLTFLAPEPADPMIAIRPTKREIEVLRWTLAGKTAWEVGMLLNISERTAAIHANRAAHKLGCVSKHQAALKAMRLGLI